MNPRVLLHNTETVEAEATLATLTPRYTERAVDFINKSKGSPFFLYFPHTYPHIPLAASERFRGKSPQGLYGDVIQELDWSVGQVMEALKKNGRDKDTLVLFSSDNGPWYQGSPGPFRGRKGMTWEGGVRVPLIARMPGAIPAGRVSNGIASAMDIVPTAAKLAGTTMKNAPDGIDIWPMLSGKSDAIDREALLYFDNVHVQCARWKNWKLHVARYNSVTYSPAPPGGRLNLRLPHPELYDIATDRDESYDVAPERPDIVKEIQGRVERLIAGFPEDIQKAWADTKTRPTGNSPVGQITRAK
jgi:arylsulfatase